MLFAAHHKLDNLTVIIDNNNLQSITTVEETISLSPLFKKLVAFNFDVIEIDGHNHDEIYLSLTKAKVRKPRAIIARTIKEKGVSFMENTVKWHYACPNDEELKEALKQLE